MTLINFKGGEEKSSPKLNDDVPKSSSKIDGKIRILSFKRGDEHIPLPKKVEKQIPTTRGPGKDQILPQYSTGEDKTLAWNKDQKKLHQLTKAVKTKFRQKEQKINYRKLAKEPYADVCIVEDTDSFTLFTSKYYKAASSFDLIRLRMRPFNCGLKAGTGPDLLQKERFEVDWLPSIPPCDITCLKCTTN